MAGGLAETARWSLVTTAELVAPFLALSFLVGLLQAWLPPEKVRSVFGRRRPVAGYLIGAGLGALTPFCSYCTIPALAGLLRSGTPFGPTMPFLFASPLLDPAVLRAVHIPLLSHSARRVLYGGTQAENKPTHLTGDRKFASDP